MNYRITIKDLKSINHADIRIDGITVISGENGSGKSTIGRWLYYLINGMTNYKENVRENFRKKQLARISDTERIFPVTLGTEISGLSQTISQIPSHSPDFYSRIKTYNSYFIQLLSTELNAMVESKSQAELKRIFQFFNPSNTDEIWTDFESLVLIIKKNIEQSIDHEELISKELEFRPIKRELMSHLIKYYQCEEELSDNIRLFESEVPLMDSVGFKVPIGINRAIYIDTPMVLSDQALLNTPNGYWGSLQRMLLNPSRRTVSIETKELLTVVSDILGGNIEMESDALLKTPKDLYFVRKTDGLRYRLSDAATGTKSFAIIIRLLENGYLNENTMLIIDEPESHLHPSWIVEFARVLVLLQKKLGVKITIATHSPDMLDAIQAIASKENTLSSCNFYLAKKDINTQRFNFCFEGTGIDESFGSFNQSIKKIQQYGASVLQ